MRSNGCMKSLTAASTAALGRTPPSRSRTASTARENDTSLTRSPNVTGRVLGVGSGGERTAVDDVGVFVGGADVAAAVALA